MKILPALFFAILLLAAKPVIGQVHLSIHDLGSCFAIAAQIGAEPINGFGIQLASTVDITSVEYRYDFPGTSPLADWYDGVLSNDSLSGTADLAGGDVTNFAMTENFVFGFNGGDSAASEPLPAFSVVTLARVHYTGTGQVEILDATDVTGVGTSMGVAPGGNPAALVIPPNAYDLAGGAGCSNFDVLSELTPIPEPSSLCLLGLVFVGLGVTERIRTARKR